MDTGPVWRLWVEGKATLTELERMSLDDVILAVDVLDAWKDAERRATEAQRIGG